MKPKNRAIGDVVKLKRIICWLIKHKWEIRRERITPKNPMVPCARCGKEIHYDELSFQEKRKIIDDYLLYSESEQLDVQLKTAQGLIDPTQILEDEMSCGSCGSKETRAVFYGTELIKIICAHCKSNILILEARLGNLPHHIAKVMIYYRSRVENKLIIAK